VENRFRLINHIMSAIVNAIGPRRVGVRRSPLSPFSGMKKHNPIPQFTNVTQKASNIGLAHLHLVESQVSGSESYEGSESLDFAYDLWDGRLLVARGYILDYAQQFFDEKYPHKDILVIFGMYFISNPDLVYGIKWDLELNAYERKTFYSHSSPRYVDYPFSTEYVARESLKISSE
jgi:NADPH2 dehydrogenase